MSEQVKIAGVAATDLAKEYGTPLYVYDVPQMRQQMRDFKQAFENRDVAYAVSYASKAFATVAMYEVVKQEGLHLDIVSGGELYTARRADFPMENISFNGNNKSAEELQMAIDYGVGTVIVDNFYELNMLEDLLKQANKTQDVLLRVSPGISAHTHEYISTGQVDSKFGFDVDSGQMVEAVKLALASEHLNVLGLHAHIGSQIFEEAGFQGVATRLVELAEQAGFVPKVLDVGGGFGIRYTEDDQPLPPTTLVDDIITSIETATQARDLPMPEIWIEPGRSIAGPSGYSLYTVGSRKDLPGMRHYVAVDGGMGDNIRPALYQADYEAKLAEPADDREAESVRLVGKYCESGDILIDEQTLPKLEPGDVVVMNATGAYGYSMASNYNRNPRPGVVFVENGQSQEVVQRETYADMVRLDHHYEL
ncbi:diaminopimelate decarboxylase [Weissella viridescens]|uniref:diaminopimelate decarboxylase n=1 Tax=Weissella viridescens TaxID=1629 RepID=UPI001D07798F|nr:diaminopimelate decarboxylase [Weissella viridescens]MCB6839477.1 diaminopimelate decarboxylase [Weissella viridescens]MCB6846208.1 diaminopimelate decarboxylase [Weissella viridescens]